MIAEELQYFDINPRTDLSENMSVMCLVNLVKILVYVIRNAH